MIDQQEQEMTGNPLDLLRKAHEVFLEVLSNVRPEQMTPPAPDDEWDVRSLINHVVLIGIVAVVNAVKLAEPTGMGSVSAHP